MLEMGNINICVAVMLLLLETGRLGDGSSRGCATGCQPPKQKKARGKRHEACNEEQLAKKSMRASAAWLHESYVVARRH